MKIRWLVVLVGLNSMGVNYTYADSNEKAASEAFLKKTEDSRESRLSKIHASLFAEEMNVSHIDKEIKGLIQIYKNHLQRYDAAKKLPSLENVLLQDINLLLGHLEKGNENLVYDQGKVTHCFDLISAIESMFEKLENPENDFSDLDLPLQSVALISSYKRLKGEQLPYYLTGSVIGKKIREDANDLPPISLAQIKFSTLIAEHSESKSQITIPCYE